MEHRCEENNLRPLPEEYQPPEDVPDYLCYCPSCGVQHRYVTDDYGTYGPMLDGGANFYRRLGKSLLGKISSLCS